MARSSPFVSGCAGPRDHIDVAAFAVRQMAKGADGL
jgi:hypothetical protein